MKYEDMPRSLDEIPFPAITINNELVHLYTFRRFTLIWLFSQPSFNRIVSIFKNHSDAFFTQGMLCDTEYVVRYVDFKGARKPEDFMSRVKELYEHEWFENQTASWNTNFKAEFTEVMTKRGFGFAFNMLPDSELFTEE